MASFLSQASAVAGYASSWLQQSAILANYTLASTQGGPAPCTIGLWKVERATSSAGKVVSVWQYDKSSGSSSSSGSARAKQRVDKANDVAKREASLLTKLRHPCILEVVEPLEETRSSFIFATEPVTAPLRDAIKASAGSSSRSRRAGKGVSDSLELDEVEIQKGLLQIGKGLQFLHEQAKLVHLNLTEEAIVINAKGDWKLAGFGLSTYLSQSDGTPARWSFPEQDHRLSPAAQLNYDYLAPEYAVDEQPPLPANDMYSLGCVVYATHTHSGPPFSNRGDLSQLRRNVDNLGVLRAQWSRLPAEVQDVLAEMITRYPSNRLTASTFQTSRYFNSVLVATLRFLDRDNFNGKSKEEQASFMKGLTRILPQFSDKLVKRKILPTLLEETRKHMLLPFLLPNIFLIAQKMDTDEFREELLPQLKPLFAIKEPPQSVLIMLDHIQLFEQKCTPVVFREECMPLVYAALESDLQPVLEKALAIVPKLAASLDYTTVKTILFPAVAKVFSKTTYLSVKVNTLICFHAMIATLDKYTLTEKLVPLLARIKTKEPSVMVATLAVHEEIGKKIEIDSIATLILPQLWAMSMGPLLNAEQFARFMAVIRQLGARVESEHSQHLAELKRLENTQGGAKRGINGTDGLSGLAANGEVDFETLVRGAQSASQQTIVADPFGAMDDGPATFDSLFPASNNASRTASPAPRPTPAVRTPSLAQAAVSAPILPQAAPMRPAVVSPPPTTSSFSPPPMVNSFAQPMAPTQPSSYAKPVANNLSPALASGLPPLAPTQSSLAGTYARPMPPSQPPVQKNALGARPLPAGGNWNVVKPAAFGNGEILQPSKAPAQAGKGTANFADLDPFG